MMHSAKSIVGSSTWDGTLSPDEFRDGAHAFAEKWERVGGYLSLEKMCIVRSDKIDNDQIGHAREEEPNSSEDRVSTDPAMLVMPAHEVHYYDFHILYSNTYRIPVLYFRGYSCDGQPLMLDQIERDLPANSAKLLTESKWTFITQQEHPYLNRPWYTLHPCGTNELMSLLNSDTSLSKVDEVAAERYLISWLSIVSQVVGLRVPLEIAASHPM